MRRREQRHVFDALFVMILFFVFLLCALTIVVIGSTVYQRTTENMNANFSTKTALNYILEKARQKDMGGGHDIITIDNVQVLQLRQNIDGVYYDTLIYEYDQNLMEKLIRTDADITLSGGNIIMEDISVEFSRPIPNLIQVDMVDGNGNHERVSIAERSAL